MNRKLLNGLLVLAVAAGGVGTFTSCKDEDFRNDVLLGEASLQAQIDAIRGVNDKAFKENLEAWLDNLTEGYSNPYNWTYEEMVQAVAALQSVYDNVVAGNYDAVKDYVDGLYKMMFENIFPGEDWFRQIWLNQGVLDNLLERASSVSVSQTYNPVFGTINLPIGVNTMVLASYEYESKETVSFPGGAYLNLASASPFRPTANDPIVKAIQALATSETLENETFSMPQEFGNMGGAVITINPQSVDFTNGNYTVELVNSKGEVALSSADGEETPGLELAAYDDVLTFGYTRDDNTGVYALKANANASNWEGLKFDLDKSELKAALKQFMNNKTPSNIAHLGEAIFESMNNKLPAYAVKVSWTENQAVVGSFNADGTPVTEEVTNSVISDFDLAAVVAHPLSYGTSLGSYIPSGKQLPHISPLQEYFDLIESKLSFTIDRLSDVQTVDVWISAKDGKIYFWDNEEMTGTPIAMGEYDADGMTLSDEEIQELANAILGTYNNDVQNKNVIADIQKAIDDINEQIEDFEGKVGDFKQYLENARNSTKLIYAQKLVDLYNQVADKVNDFLAYPDHYLQVMMVYSAGDGAHHLSTDPNYPVTFNSANGDAFELFASSYTGDVVVPSYKKYVAITQVDGQQATKDINGGDNAEFLNVNLPGQIQRIPVKITSAMKGHTLTITYVSVDYRGVSSMANYYVRVK